MGKRLFSILLIVVFMTAVFSGCGAQKPAEENKPVQETTKAETKAEETKKAEEPKTEEKKLIGLSMHFMQDDYAVNLVKTFKDVLTAKGYEVEATDAGGDPQKQLNDVQTLVTKKISALVIVPMDEKAVKDACNDAAKSGIPVISVTHMPDANVATEIKGGDYENGLGAGKLLVEKLGGKGKVLVLDCNIELFRIQERVRGFMDAIKGTDIQIVDTKKMITKEDAMSATQNVLTAHPDVKGIFGSFGNLIYGAGSALKTMNKTDVAVTGIDADISIMNLINEGFITGAAAQFPADHGKLAAEAVIKVLGGQKPDQTVDVPFKMVTKENVKDMAKSLWDKEIK